MLHVRLIYLLLLLSGLTTAVAPRSAVAADPSCVLRNLETSDAPETMDLQILRSAYRPTSLKLTAKAQSDSRLQDDIAGGVLYFKTPEAREPYRLYAHEGLLYDGRGKLFDTQGNKAMYVMDEAGAIFAQTPELLTNSEMTHHSTFLNGNPVAAGGELIVKRGVIQQIDNGSGHYKPGKKHLFQVQDRFKEMGVHLPIERIFIHNAKHPISVFDPAPFRDPLDFQKGLLAYDPTDWPKAIAVAMESKDPSLRKLGITTLGDARVPHSEELTRLLKTALADPDSSVRSEAYQSLRQRNTGRQDVDYNPTIQSLLANPSLSSTARKELLNGLVFERCSTSCLDLLVGLLQKKAALDPAELNAIIDGSLTLSRTPTLAARAESIRKQAIDQLWKIKADPKEFSASRDADLSLRQRDWERYQQQDRSAARQRLDLQKLQSENPDAGPFWTTKMSAEHLSESARSTPFSPERRAMSRVYVHQGRLYDAQGELMGQYREIELIYVMDGSGRVYLTPGDYGRTQHASILEGAPVAGAGTVRIKDGEVTLINNASEQYLPSHRQLFQVVKRFKDLGMDIDWMAIQAVYSN